MSNNYLIIMAGGAGTRFWPMSRTGRPKQFLDVLGTGKTLIRATFERFKDICPPENVYVVTTKEYKDLTLRELPELKEEQVLLEPMRRNTAPCIAYANFRIKQKNPDANIVVSPADHLIVKEEEFRRVINEGLDFVANNDQLLTLGIKPSRPDTGYGYIQVDNDSSTNNGNLKKVKTFTEKPDHDLAKIFFESGEFFWNSGIFLWSLKSINDAFDNNLPEVNDLFRKGEKVYGTGDEPSFIDKTYAECINISIDYGVMEKAQNVHVLCSDFGWSDLGTWGSLYAHSNYDENGNAVHGEKVLFYDSANNIVNVPKDKLVVLQGLDNYIVVESDGILLICRKDDEQKIRQFVNDVKINIGNDFV